MTIGPVFWGSYPGDMLEKLMAVLIAQDHPHALRRTPSSGDGGVDILIDEAEGWHVRQVKSFFGRMRTPWRRQVEKSFADLLNDARLSRPITRWTLTVPIDPTSGEQAWFEELTTDAPFPCLWDGEIYWHSLAARHPHVIDYYLRDGRGRVEARSDDLLSVTRAPQLKALTAIEVAGHLETLRSLLNRDDPHYLYEFHTGAEPPPREGSPPGTVLVSSRHLDDGNVLTIFLVARHRHATDDAPITGNVNVTVYDAARAIDVREAFEDFRRFGRGLDLPDGALDAVFDAPAGLGGTIEAGGGRIGPMQVAGAPKRSRLRLVDPQGSVMDLRLTHRSVTRGEQGGVEIQATDDHEVLNLTLRLWPPDNGAPSKLTLNFGFEPLHERPVMDVVPSIRLLAGLLPPAEVQWMEEHGARVIANHQITEDPCIVPQWIARFISNLATVQGHVRGTVFIPQDIDSDVIQEAADLAQLIRTGERHRTWSEYTMPLRDDANAADVMKQFSHQGALCIEAAWTWDIDGHRYDIGVTHQIMAQARLADAQPPDGRSIRLVPGEDNSVVERLGSRLPTAEPG